MASLTKSQQLVYDYLCSTMAERAVPPSVREICAATGLRSTSTVHSHLKSLEALGYITRDAGLNRSIHIVGASAAKQVPILGKVTAGLPILAVEDIEGYIPYPDKSGKELFALHVDGLSMINAGILDGDYVIAEKTPVAENGELQFTDALNLQAAEKGLYAKVFEGRRYDLGSKAGYLAANVEYALRDENLGGGFAEYLKNLSENL